MRGARPALVVILVAFWLIGMLALRSALLVPWAALVLAIGLCTPLPAHRWE